MACAFWALVGLPFLLCGNSPAMASKVKVTSETGWDQCLDSALAVPAVRYAFYAYRTMAVEHPEILLKADQLISDVLEDLPGSRLAYNSQDVRDVELYLRLARRETKGGAFGWGMMTLHPDSVYDRSPLKTASDWLHLRAPSAAVLLKSDIQQFSTFECALLRYNQLVRTGRAADELFLVLDRRGKGYLAADTLLWEAGLSSRPAKKWTDVAPVLVFNRHSVFSALTGRDDREHDSVLSRIMGRIGKPYTPSMGSRDKQRLAATRRVTSLPTDSARRLAILAASGLVDRKQPRVDLAWAESEDSDTSLGQCETLRHREVLFWANRLSLRTADLAKLIHGADLAQSLDEVEKRFLASAGRRVSDRDSADQRIEAWGCLWSYDLFEITADDIVRTRSGSTASQALAMSAVLDLAGVEHFQLSIRFGDLQIPDQEWLIADHGRHQFNMGHWTVVPDSLPPGRRPPTLLVTGFADRGRTVRLSGRGICASIDPLAVSSRLSRISRAMNLANLAVLAPNDEIMPLQKFQFLLNDDVYQTSSVRWPSVDLP